MTQTEDSLKTVLGDLQYLVDELEALKYLIDVVPVYERPGDELSVCEHIRLIHFIQDYLADARHNDSNVISYSLADYIQMYKRQRSDIESEKSKGVQHYINKLTQARVGLLSALNNDVDLLDSNKISQMNLLIRLERSVFKEMAEKVLAINKEA